MKLDDYSKYNNDSNEDGAYEINRMRVHYFFTDTKEVMKSFLTNTEIELRLTEGMNWNKSIAIATSFALQYFKIKNINENSESQNNENGDGDLLVQRQVIQLHFFGSKVSNFQMDMTIGIKEDLKIKTENIMLYRFNDVFFPDNSYYNSDPLPVEWIEVFQENQLYKEKKRAEEESKKDLNRSKEISLFPKDDDKLARTIDTKKASKYTRDHSANKSKQPLKKGDWTEQMEINGNSHSAIKKTLEIYSVISNVNKGLIKDDLSGIEEDK